MDLFKLLGTIVIDNANANKALAETSGKAKDTAEDVGAVSDSGNKTSSKFATAMGKVGSAAVKVGKVVATGIATAGAAIGGVTVKALSSAGELEQNMGGSEAVFKDYAGKMQNTAKTAFSNMGLSASDFLGTANKMGALFQGAGFDIETSATMSADAMQRAADVASIMGIDTASAMEAIAGAAKGNFTMMDNLGVAMNDTTLQAYALSKGINKSTQDMTNQEKIGLAMEMFMEKTAYAAGNYAKENETLAGSLGTAKAALSNFLSGAGTVEDVVSSFKSAGTVIVKNIKEMFPALMTGMTEIVRQLIPEVPPLLEQLLPSIITGATGLINGLVAAMPQIISALMSALPALIDGVISIVNALVSALPQIIEALVAALPGLIPQLVNGIVSMIITICTMFPKIIQPIIDYLPAIIISLVDALMQNLPALIQGLVQLTVGIVAAIPQIIVSLIEALPTILTSIVQGLFASAPILWEGIKSIWNTAVDGIKAIFESLKNFLSKAWEAMGKVPGLSTLKTIIESAWNAIKNIVSTLITSIKNVVSTAWNSIKNVVSTVISSIKNVISTVWNAIKTIIANVMNIIFSVIKGDWESVKNSISNIINAIKSVISSVWNGIKNVISSVVSGIKNTVSSYFEGIKNTISSVINNIKTHVTNVFNAIKDAMAKPIEKAKEIIGGIIDKIKGFFSGMKLQFPNIKLPHFTVKPSGWQIGDLLKGKIPSLGIDWYARAMNEPLVMNNPTVFGYNPTTGRLQGGGEAGSEVVSGTNTLLNMISGVVAEQNSALAYYLQKLIAMMAEFLPQILAAAGHDIVADDGTILARYVPKFNIELGKISNRKDRGR